MTPELTYAIADIHGCRFQLELLLAEIESHAAGRPHRIITMGDYCDRGPDTKGVLDLLIARDDIVKLKGNHEEMFLEARYGGMSDRVHWLRHGGNETLDSFDAKRMEDVSIRYYDFMKNLPLYFEDEHRVFVHAGIAPGSSDMTRQNSWVMLWVRDDFLRITEPFFKFVVHGHTPQMTGIPDLQPNRLNLDTGCFRTERLSCGVFTNDRAAPVGIFITMPGGVVQYVTIP